MVMAVIGRLRRAQPRNDDVLFVCEELEKVVTKPKFDRKAYMRQYMRDRRALDAALKG